MSARINKYREALLEHLQMNKRIVRAKGHHLEDETGQIYLDCLSQYGALPFGHNPDFILEALQRHIDAGRACLVQPLFTEEACALAERLRQAINPQFKYCLFTNSGTEAVEAAIKLARLRSGRKAILSLEGSFHGKTYASLSATSSQRHKNELIADYQDHTIVPVDDLERIRHELAGQRYAAILLEPVQGEGGMRPFSEHWLEALIAIAHEYNTLVIFDEVQTGLGRCGEITLSQTLAELPDIILLSKALGGGVIPIGAVLYRQTTYISTFDKKHSSTFAGNGLAAAVGLAVVDELTRDDGQRLQAVRTLTHAIENALQQLRERYPQLLDYSGRGLMWSLKICDDNCRENLLLSFLQCGGGLSYLICSYLMNHHGLFTMPLLSEPCSIRYEPALDSTEEEVQRFLGAIDEVCKLLAHGRYDILMAHLAGVDRETLSSPGRIYSVSPVPVQCRHARSEPVLPSGKRFAFFMHATSETDYIRGYPVAIKREYSEAAQARLARLLMDIGRTEYSPEAAYSFTVRGRHSQSEGVLIFSPIDSADMMKLPPREKKVLIDEFLQVARQERVELIGLGAYTSVITRAGELLDTSTDDLAVTTGNSITAMSTLDALSELIQPQQATAMRAAIIGARGSVGRLIALGMSHYFGHVTLVGRTGSEDAVLASLLDDLCALALDSIDPVVPGSVLDKIRRRLLQDGTATQAAALSARQLHADCEQLGISACAVDGFDMCEMDCIVSSTSEGKPFLKSHFKPDAVIFDVARPFDFVETQNSSQILEGGLVRQPQATTYTDNNLIGTPEGVNLGCLSETIALALDSAQGRFSIGKSIPYEQARKIYQTARDHGFSAHSYR